MATILLAEADCLLRMWAERSSSSRLPHCRAEPRPAALQATVAPPDKVQMASDEKDMRDVYVPIQLFGPRAVALLDTRCDTSIIGARLLPDGADVRPTTHTLLATNGTSIPLEGEYNVHFWVAGKEFNICAVVTKSVHEFILGIDFLSENACMSMGFWNRVCLNGRPVGSFASALYRAGASVCF